MSAALLRHRPFAAAFAILAAGGMVLASTAAVAGAAPAPRAAFAKTIASVVSPGTLASATFAVPSGKTVELGKLTLHSTGGSQGVARFQLLQQGKAPETLLEAGLGQIGTAFTATFTTAVQFKAGDTLALTVSCDPNQAACATDLALSGQLVASSAHSSGNPVSLDDVVAPGTTGITSWSVPAKQSLALTDLLASTFNSGQTGGLKIVVTPKGGKARTLLRMTLTTLGKSPFDYRLSGPVTLPAGSTVTLTVVCAANQPACEGVVLLSGRSS
jgi:hypothetical protein